MLLIEFAIFQTLSDAEYHAVGLKVATKVSLFFTLFCQPVCLKVSSTEWWLKSIARSDCQKTAYTPRILASMAVLYIMLHAEARGVNQQ